MFTRTAYTAVTPPPPPYTNKTLLLYAPCCLYLMDSDNIWWNITSSSWSNPCISCQGIQCNDLFVFYKHLLDPYIHWSKGFVVQCLYFLLIHIFVHYNYSTNFICFYDYYFLLVSYEFDSLYLIVFCVKCFCSLFLLKKRERLCQVHMSNETSIN